MDTLAHGQSRLRGTGPSSYKTSPKVDNNLISCDEDNMGVSISVYTD